MFDDVIFRKTESGSQSLNSGATDMPRLVRQLLLLVNGRSLASDYARALTAYGDIYTSLTELEQAGYIERIDPSAAAPAIESRAKPHRSPAKSADTSPFTDKNTGWSTLFSSRLSRKSTLNPDETTFTSTEHGDEASDFEVTDFEVTRDAENPAKDQARESMISGFEVFDINKSLQQQSQAGLAITAAISPPPNRLELVIAEISNFILTHIGPDGQEMVNLISAFSTEAELYAFLPRYEAGLLRRGIAADAHFDRIEWLLNS